MNFTDFLKQENFDPCQQQPTPDNIAAFDHALRRYIKKNKVVLKSDIEFSVRGLNRDLWLYPYYEKLSVPRVNARDAILDLYPDATGVHGLGVQGMNPEEFFYLSKRSLRNHIAKKVMIEKVVIARYKK